FKLSEAGVHIKDTPGGLMVFGRAQQPFEIRTMVYPGFPTDLQAPMMAVACRAPGTSVFLETIFENRFMHAAELSRLGAHIRVENRVAVVEGTPRLTGASVTATDLRAGAALILAGLCAEGETLVDDSGGHIDRGYCRIEEKLAAVGGHVRRIEPPT
ncbi:MAG: UDP-N-acetylglucosamine 1-carboxyvinyltransferase, partial [Candidatus Ventricola sp.]